MSIPPCLHCGRLAYLTDGREVYPHREDLHHKPIWKCEACNATCGCHPGTTNPLGYPANKETRNARMRLHNERLDPLWRSMPKKKRKAARNALYKHLTEYLSIPADETHTGMFTVERCREAWKCLSQIDRAWLDARCH